MLLCSPPRVPWTLDAEFFTTKTLTGGGGCARPRAPSKLHPRLFLLRLHPSPSALCAILYHKGWESARPRPPWRLDGLVHSCWGYTLTEKDGLVYSCWGYTLTEKDVYSFWPSLLQTQPLFFSALFLHSHLRNPIIKCHYWNWSVDRAVTGISARSIKLKNKFQFWK